MVLCPLLRVVVSVHVHVQPPPERENSLVDSRQFPRSLFVPFGKQSAPFLVSDGRTEGEGMLGKPPLVAASFLTLLGVEKKRGETRIFRCE